MSELTLMKKNGIIKDLFSDGGSCSESSPIGSDVAIWASVNGSWCIGSNTNGVIISSDLSAYSKFFWIGMGHYGPSFTSDNGTGQVVFATSEKATTLTRVSDGATINIELYLNGSGYLCYRTTDSSGTNYALLSNNDFACVIAMK